MAIQTSRTFEKPLILHMLMVLVSSSGCDKPPGISSTGRSHPTPANIPTSDRLADEISRSQRGIEAEIGDLRRLARKMLAGNEIFSIGQLEGARHEVFGQVEDVAVDAQGNIFVLDSRFNDIRIFDPQGNLVDGFGGPGNGPNELNAPEGLALAADGRVAIADRANQTKIFRRSNHGFVYESTIRVEFVPEDICLLGDRIYLQGIKTAEASIIHEYDFGGMHHGSFGTAYQSDNLLVVNQLSDGPIACDDGADVVVMMFKLLPIVYAYSRDGELAWMTRIVDFEPMNISEVVTADGRPGVRFSAAQGHDKAEVLRSIADEIILLQVSHHDSTSLVARKDYAELHTYLLSARTGEGIYVGNTLGLIGAIDESRSRMYVRTNDPFPKVIVSELGPDGTR